MKNSDFIEEKEINLATISVELENNFITHSSSNKNSLYIQESDMFPFWISVIDRHTLIRFSTYIPFVDEVRQHDRFDFCNKINEKLYMPSVYCHKENMNADFCFYYKDGIFKSHLARLCRKYSQNLKEIISEFDDEKKILKDIFSN